MAATVALALLAALVARRLRQLLRLSFQKTVERFLHAPLDQFFDLPLDYFLVYLYISLGHGLRSPFRMLCGNFTLPDNLVYVARHDTNEDVERPAEERRNRHGQRGADLAQTVEQNEAQDHHDLAGQQHGQDHCDKPDD